ncbi:MAG: hypothetical protein ACRDRK_23340 [Pseudonocardia sp.]
MRNDPLDASTRESGPELPEALLICELPADSSASPAIATAYAGCPDHSAISAAVPRLPR